MNIFNIFNKPKKTKILIVVNKDINEPVEYYNKIDVNIETEVRSALTSIAEPFDENKIKEIVVALEDNPNDPSKVYILNGEYGFQIIEV